MFLTCSIGRLNTERWQEMETGKYTQRVFILSTQHFPFQRRTGSTDKMVKAVSPPIKRKKSNVRQWEMIESHHLTSSHALVPIRRGQRVLPWKVRVHWILLGSSTRHHRWISSLRSLQRTRRGGNPARDT